MSLNVIPKIRVQKPKKEKTPIPTREELIENAKKRDVESDRSRKTPTKEEKEKALFDKMLNYEEKKQEKQPVIEEKKEDEWDVKIGDPIYYFDPELSYELTGYRPITKDKGLDFDPKVFTKAADYFKEHKRYTNLIPGTFAHRQYWEEEFKRCQQGYTVGKYRLTGENYFFLNYFRIPSVLDKSGSELQEESFPTFLAKQYEYFHYIEMCRATQHDGMAFKSRGVGASQIAASNCACAYTFHEQTRNIVTAFADSYVDDTLSKVWQELDFLNTQTETAFRRLRMKIDTNRKKKASKIDDDKNEIGWGSIIEGITADEPRKLRGARTYNLYFEEAGSNPKLTSTYIQARALVVINGYRVGYRWVFGTAGDKGPNLAGLKDMFYNPEEYLILPYRHNYTPDGSYVFTGYFIPSYTMWFGTPNNPGFDSRGVVDEERAKKYYQSVWEKIKDPKKLMQDKAEYCFTADDAFILEGQNNFDQEKLAAQKADIMIHKLYPKPQKIRLLWKNNEGHPDINQRPEMVIDSTGQIQMSEAPIVDENGVPFKNLYVIGVDGVDLDSTTATGQTDVSKFCVVVYRRQFGLQAPKIVALYKERPKHIKDAWEISLKLAMFYNAPILVEATRTSVINYFVENKKQDLIMKRPKATANSSTKTNFKQYGVPVPPHVIEHYLDLIEQYVADYCEQIEFEEVIDELMAYSYENKRKFDIVAALGMALLAAEEMMGRTVRTAAAPPKLTLGYSRNAYGQAQFGEVKNDTDYSFGLFGTRYKMPY